MRTYHQKRTWLPLRKTTETSQNSRKLNPSICYRQVSNLFLNSSYTLQFVCSVNHQLSQMSSSSSSNATTGPPMPSTANSDDNDTNGSSINHSTTSLLRSSSSCSIPYQSVASTTTNTTNNAQPREPSPKELLHTLQSSGSVHNSDTNKVTSSSSAASSARAAPPPSTGANPIVVQQSPQDPPVNERRLTIPELAYHVTHSTSSTTPQIPKTSQYHGNLPEGSQIVPCRARGMPQDHDLVRVGCRVSLFVHLHYVCMWLLFTMTYCQSWSLT